jgi:hypothetical protein
MIRYALAFLGLSAGAVSAQTSVQGASASEICGQHIEILASDSDCQGVDAATEGNSSPDVPASQSHETIVTVRMSEKRAVAIVETGARKGPIALKRGIDLPDSAQHVSATGLHRFERDVRFVGTLDGSDPSAMFCP